MREALLTGFHHATAYFDPPDQDLGCMFALMHLVCFQAYQI